MRNIVIVECISTGKNFIGDIINRGYNPVVLHLKDSDTDDGKKFGEHVYEEYKMIPYEFDMIYEKDTYEETLEVVRKFNPLLVLPGNERGVILATNLSNDLGLLCNSIENLDAMTLKDEMQNRLAQNGLRSIKGRIVHSLDEALEFYDSENLKEIVIKPVYSAGSAGVRICLDRDEMINSIKELFSDVNYYGDKLEELLIQERINGIEYIVNTVSHKGIHRVTLVWKYNKIRTSEGAIVYDSCETVNELSLGEAEMVEYAYDVADALGIQYGPIHGEYMIDENGPVLIEVNCRPCGGGMSADFLDKISGQHETDSILDSYLKPQCFLDKSRKRYELYAHGTLKFFIVPKDMIVQSSPIANMNNKLRSFHDNTMIDLSYRDIFFRKTKDLDSAAGFVFLVHEDKSEVDKDLNFLRDIERNAFSLILSEDKITATIKDDEIYVKEIKPLIDRMERQGTGLFVTDQYLYGADIYQIKYDEFDDVKGNFDFIIVNLNKSMLGINEDDKVVLILDIISKVKTGGVVFIPKNTYELLSSGRKGMEALMKVMGYKIELPSYKMNNMVIASRWA